MRRRQSERRHKIDEIAAMQKVLDLDIARAHTMIEAGNREDAQILRRSIEERCEMVQVMINEAQAMP